MKVRPGAQKSSSTSIPAPIRGLNARDSVANMDARDALILENFFPKTTSVDVRNGYATWNTFTGICQTILIYSGLTSTKIFPCIKNGSTYSIMNGTTAGAISTAVVGGSGPAVQALTSTRFDYVQYNTAGGSFMSVVNGADTALEYDGTTWSTATLTHASLSSTNKLFTIGVFAERMWFGEEDTFNVYYLPVRTKSGAMTQLNLGSWFKLGGYLNSIITMTDNSAELTDYIGFMSSEGEVVVYRGTDPATSATWIQSGHFKLSHPVSKGNRTWCKYGADALVLCHDGVYPLRKCFQTQGFDNGLSVSDKIRNTLNSEVSLYGLKYGWQVLVYADGQKLFVNVPTNEDVASYQYVMNTETGAWCKYTGWTAFCFEAAKSVLYWGGDGKTVKADTTANDGDDPITAVAKQSFNYLGSRGIAKHVKMLRPILATDGELTMSISVDVDYGNVEPSYLRPFSSGAGGDPWGGIWDVAWSGAVTATNYWFGVNGIGHAIAPRIKSVTDGVILSWSATDVVYENGGILA